MIKKTTIANILLLIIVLYYASPWFFEKTFLFNELLAFVGITVLLHKRFRLEDGKIQRYFLLLMTWGGVHIVLSLFRMDSIYYYLRNLVIIYSMFTFFLGYYLYKYLSHFADKVRKILQWYIGIFVFIPLPRALFDRYGISMLFPLLFRKADKWTIFILILLNFIYAISHGSSTAGVLGIFYILLAISPGYRFFKQTAFCVAVIFILFFIYVQPNLTLIKSPVIGGDIDKVLNSNPILKADGNNTWRLVLWNQIIVNHFPANMFGMGFGTPLLSYFPIEDYTKVSSLPYILGGHNSYVYLFGRLGIVYVVLAVLIYREIFKEYFIHKQYYYSNNTILIFWSFFAVSIIAMFNVVLESPIYAGGYWLLLGLVARSISDRKSLTSQQKNADTIYS